MNQLYHLAYISKNNIAGDAATLRKEIETILVAAQTNNQRAGITGALLFSGGYFCQVIEGDKDKLEELFETIQMDARHSEVTVLEFEPVAERGFPAWTMAFAGMEETMRFDIEGIRASKDQLAMHEAGRNLVHVLERLVLLRQSVADKKSGAKD